MTIAIHELKRGRISLMAWTAAIAGMVLVCLVLFPEMKGEMDTVSDMFASMGSFTAAFGMDQLNFGELMGFYGVECGNVLGLGGAMYAAILGISALAGEEKNHTAEFLLTHPISRSRAAAEKFLAILLQICILNAVTVLVSVIMTAAIGETLQMKEFLLLHLAYLLLQVEIAAICFSVSAFLRRGSLGAGLGLALLLYFMNLLANISDQAQFLQWITPYAYADAASIISEGTLDAGRILLGLAYAAVSLLAAFWYYNRKDIA